jgi:hypothetical protein
VTHTDWCARDHRCGLREHTSEPIAVDVPGYGRAVVTRVRDAQGRECADVRVRIALASDEYTARWQLRTALTALRDLLTLAARPTAVRRKRAS